MFGYNLNREYTDFMVEVVRMTGCESYLELGVERANNIHAIAQYCDCCIGVDVADKRVYKDFEFHKMTTDMFFSKNKKTFDIIFIDADHSFASVKRDFFNSLLILNKFGIIFIHDTDPIGKEFLKPELCGDSYKIIDWLHGIKKLNVLTLPVSVAGLTMVTKREDRRVYGINGL